MSVRLYLQNYGRIDLNIQEKGPWRARAITKKTNSSNTDNQCGREESLQIVVQNHRKFAYVDLDTVELSKASQISKITNQCRTFSISSDGRSLFGIKKNERPKFVTLANDFQEIKTILPHIGMQLKTHLQISKNQCPLYKFRRRLTQLYSQIVGRDHLWYKRSTIFPYILPTFNGLAMLCVMDPGLCYIWEYHKTIGFRWSNIGDCVSATVPGRWKKVFLDKIQIDEWFKCQRSPRIESRILFNKHEEVAGALAYTSLTHDNIQIMYAPIEKEGQNFFFKFSKIVVDLQRLRNKPGRNVAYISRLNSTGSNLAIGINAHFDSYVVTIAITADEDIEISVPQKALKLCQHSKIGLSLYDMSNHKYCWIVDIQWIAQDTMFAVMTNCGSLAVFDTDGKSVLISLLSDAAHIKPAIYHQIFQKAHDPDPTEDCFDTIRPPETEYWGKLLFSMLWSASQNILTCTSGRTLALFSVVHIEQSKCPSSCLAVDSAVIKQERESDIEILINIIESVCGCSPSGDVMSPSFTLANLKGCPSILAKTDPIQYSNLLKTIEMLVSQLPEPHMTIRPVKVDLSTPKNSELFPRHLGFREKIPESTSSDTNAMQYKILENVTERNNEIDQNVVPKSISLPDFHTLLEAGNGRNGEDDECSEYDCKGENNNNVDCTSPVDSRESISLICTPTDAKDSDDTLVHRAPLEIPAVPHIHSVIPLVNYREIVSSTNNKQCFRTSVSTQTPLIEQNHYERTILKEKSRCRPTCNIVRSVSSTDILLKEEEDRKKEVEVTMVRLQPFEKLSDVLEKKRVSSADTPCNPKETQKKTMEKAKRILGKHSGVKKRQEQKLGEQKKKKLPEIRVRSEMLVRSRVQSNEDLLSISSVGPPGSGRRKLIPSKPSNEVPSEKRFRAPSVKNVASAAKKMERAPPTKSTYSSNPITTTNRRPVTPRPLLPSKLAEKKFALAASPKVSPFIQAAANTNGFCKVSTALEVSNARNNSTMSNCTLRNQTKKSTTLKVNAAAEAQYLNKNIERKKTLVSNTSLSSDNPKTTFKTYQEEVSIPTRGTSRGAFTNDSEKLMEQIRASFNKPGVGTENSRPKCKKKFTNCVKSQSLTDPFQFVQDSSQWVRSQTLHLSGFDRISKSGHLIRSRSSSSAGTVSSNECFRTPGKRRTPSEEEFRINTFKESSARTEEDESIIYGGSQNVQSQDLLPSYQELQLPALAHYKIEVGNTNGKSYGLVVKMPKRQLQTMKLVVEEEEIENIPLKPILSSSNSKKCGRRVSFCEPIALYKTLSPEDLTAQNYDDENENGVT